MEMNWFDIGWPFRKAGWDDRNDRHHAADRHVPRQYRRSRWRDPVWLGWLAAPLYLLHQVEEYSLSVLGFDCNAIQAMVCKNMGHPPYVRRIELLIPCSSERAKWFRAA
jgi:hypothetical protein